MKYLLTALLLLLVIAASAEATTYWASTSGNGATCGTTGTSDPGSGYTTLTKGISCLTAAGDILILKNGSYTNPGATVAAIDCGSIGNGSAGNYKTIRAQNERMAVLQNDGLHASMTVTNCSWVKIEGLRMRSQANLGGTVTTLSLMVINGGSNNVIRRNLFDRTNVERYNADKGAVPDSTLVSNVLSESITIEENEFYQVHRHGIAPYCSSASNPPCIIRRNYYHVEGSFSVAGTMMSLYPNSNMLVENNINVQVDGGMFELNAPGTDGVAALNNQFYGNISIGCGPTLDTRGNSLLTMVRNTTLQDNLVVQSGSCSGMISADHAKNTVLTNNTSIVRSGSAPSYGLYGKSGSEVGDGSSSLTANNNIIVGYGTCVFEEFNHTGGFTVNKTGFRGCGTNFSSAFGHTSTNAIAITAGTQTALNTCPAFIGTAMTELKSQGTGGADVGANILYATENGVLTSKPLWNTATNELNTTTWGGAIVDAALQTKATFGTRLHPSCTAWPVGYGAPVTVAITILSPNGGATFPTGSSSVELSGTATP